MPTDILPPAAPAPRYRALPAQLIAIDGGVIVVRGCTEIRIMGERAEQTALEVWDLAAEAPVTIEEIVSRYAEPDRAAVEQLARKLVDRRILVEAEQEVDEATTANGVESALEVFYWHFGLTERDASLRLSEKRLAIVGLNAISLRLAAALAEAKIENVVVVDYVTARNQRLFGSKPEPDLDHWPCGARPPLSYKAWIERDGASEVDCLIAASDFGATSALLQWNSLCLERGIEFLPIVLRRMVGYVGPLVVPGDTACYACVCARENSHLRNYEALRKSEQATPFGQAVSGFFPSMGSILGDVAAIELVKFYTGRMPYKSGRLIEVNLLAPSMTTRKALRVPRCEACAPMLAQSAMSLDRADFVPGAQFFEGDKLPQSKPLTALEKFDKAASGGGVG